MINKILRSIFDFYKFYKIHKHKRRIVFYSENRNSYEFFEGIINKLQINNYQIYYITSEFNDPVFKNKEIYSFYIGYGSLRTIFFQFFNSQIMILTMPDLNNAYIKKSKFCNNYIYITHNICSLHMGFRAKAFNGYDTFFCVGPHHNTELKEIENLYSLKIKKFNFGYYKIDKLLSQISRKNLKILLIAPSWGKNCIIEKYGTEVLDSLRDLNWKIIIRPHPDTIIKYNKKYNNLKNRFRHFKNFEFQEHIDSMNIFLEASIMISDWSGAAFEFSLGLEKPVIFIDVPKKINNDYFKFYNSIPVEVKLREKIGEIVKINDIPNLSSIVENLFKNKDKFQKKIRNEREKYQYNVGSSSEQGYKYIKNLID